MYIINKIVGGCLNPLVIGMMLIAVVNIWLQFFVYSTQNMV